MENTQNSSVGSAITAVSTHASVSSALDSDGIGAALTVVANNVERHPVGGTDAIEYDFQLPSTSGPEERSSLTVRDGIVTSLALRFPAISAEDLSREEAKDRAERVLRDIDLHQPAAIGIDSDLDATAETDGEHRIVAAPVLSQEPIETINAIRAADKAIVEEFGL